MPESELEVTNVDSLDKWQNCNMNIVNAYRRARNVLCFAS